MYVTVPITMQSKDMSRSYDEYEPRERKANGRDETGVMERKEYLKVPVWAIILLVTLLLAFLGTLVNTTITMTTIRNDVSQLRIDVNGQVTTSLQSQINELQQEKRSMQAEIEKLKIDKADSDRVWDERYHDLKFRLGVRGVIR